jgi:hypothetical protein
MDGVLSILVYQLIIRWAGADYFFVAIGNLSR